LAAIHARGEIAQEIHAPLIHALCAGMYTFGGSRIRIINPPVWMRR
jgi:hypothetical protein